MKYIIIICFTILITAHSCQKDDYESEGLITGADPRDCVCCGGWFIEIDLQVYRFYEIPPGSDLDLTKESFPVKVRLDWQKDPDACLGDEILVSRIKKK